MSNIIRIDENGPRIESNGTTVASDLKLTFQDYLPAVTNWSTWNGTLQAGDTVDITTASKFIAVRARNTDTATGSTMYGTNGTINLISACLPANNSLGDSCGCSSSAGASGVLLDFEMNQYTTYNLDEETIYSTNTEVFDFTHGATAYGVTGWLGCTCTTIACGVTGATGATGPGNTYAIGGTGATASAQGVYEYVFVGVLRDGKFDIQTTAAESDYKCDKAFYTYAKVDDDTIVFVFDDTTGRWLIVRLDQTITDIVTNDVSYNIMELIEWSTTSYTYNNSNITMPAITGATATNGTNSYAGTVTELDADMPVTFKLNSLFMMESKSFTGKITSRVNNLDVNIMLAI